MDYIKVAHDTLDIEINALQQLKERLDESFNEIVQAILHCEGRLVIGGIGKSGLIGRKMVATFASTGTPSLFLHPTEAFHGDLGMLKEDDIVLLISYSGETDDVNKLIPSLRSFGNKIIAMTSNPDSTLAKHSDYWLNIQVEREACPNNLAPTTSALLTLALADALTVALIKARNFKAADFARFHPGGSLGRRLLSRVRDVMHKDNLPLISAESSFANCLEVMTNSRLGVAIIVKDEELQGIITDGDIRRAFTAQGAKCLRLQAKDIMTTSPKTVEADSYLNDAEEFMRSHKIHSLLVLEDNKLVGLLEFSA